jgi:probable F420-dependent oxidoreductase
MDLGRIGIWTGTLDGQPVPAAQEAVGELESLGYGAVWIPETVGREALTNSMLLLAGGERIVVATGIANIWGRDALTMATGHKTVTSAYPDRFLLGLGVSHAPLVVGVRGHDYSKPLTTMRTYLEAMDATPYMAVPPPAEPVRVLAALRPKMLELSRTHASGAHPYFVPPEHTADARAVLGEGPMLLPEQAVLLETDPARAREIGRKHTRIYVGLPNYTNNLRLYGFGDEDFADGGSDRLVDAIVAWGDLDAVKARVQALLDAGADHVCLQVLAEDPRAVPMAQWRELASAFDLS